jgi:hypothetical protein
MSEKLVIAGRTFASRLIVGTGKYRSFQEMQRCHEASGADMVTVAVRRVNLTDRSKESLLDYIDREKLFILPKYGRVLHGRRCDSHSDAGARSGAFQLGQAGSDRRREDAVPGQ